MGQRWGAENLGRPIGSGRPSRLRLLLAFAATLAAAALLGCDKKIPNPSGRHMQPLSQEILAELDGKGMTHAHINMLANGHEKPSLRAMELIAQACDVDPHYFAEYRLAMAMRALDPEQVGFEQALANLSARLDTRRRSGASPRPVPRPRAKPRPTG